jgi:hypothetical protein
MVVIFKQLLNLCGPGSSVGIATGYGLDCPGIEFLWGEFCRTCPDPAWGVMLTSHPLLVPRSKNRVVLYLYSP